MNAVEFEGYLSHLPHPVILLDKLYQVIGINPSFQALFPLVQKGENLYAFTADYPMLSTLLSFHEGQHQFTHSEQSYTVHVTYMRYGKRQRPVARCILLSDVTDTIRLLQETQKQSALLKASNEQIQLQNQALQENIRLDMEMASLREQSLLLRDIHDTLGHTLTVLSALHTLALNALPNEQDACQVLRESLRLTDISIAELDSMGDYKTGSFVAFLRRFRDSMRSAGLSISLDIDGEETERHHYMYGDLVRITQEAATNSIRHGNATQLDVALRIAPDSISLSMADNGKSTGPMKQGNGLASMDERVNNLFGDFSYGKTERGGFWIQVHAPVIDDE